ncbi:TetR/AcrR family transcriptional regulator [Nordella sp. HKS 07]|uniref:TetR/AcrR family transcriptional regulator n=1 Tax=Nordella sp. HKS 07 TaxID=2712222 RepID=UPI0013E1FAB0|nr:TetR/AcrR family transcriptional regulator [Nordella sp. HKS 07]QIG47706.1 TetR/AcrR family transcriptional regulator [Nordella sp. HKS 07]
MRKVDPQKHEAKRRQILDAAVICFARSGFHKTSTAEICAEAGMSPGNLFHYFKNKNAIIEAIVDEDRRQISEWYEKALKADDLFEELFKLMQRNLELIAEPTYRKIGIEIFAEAMRNPTVGQLVARNDAEQTAALTGILKQAAARGQIDATLDVGKLATWIAALGDGAFGRAALDPYFDPTGQAGILREVLTRILKPQAER